MPPIAGFSLLVIRVEDSVWRVKGPDLEAGESVEVTGVEGGVLLLVAPVRVPIR